MLQSALREGVEELFPGKLWVRAEIASINQKSNGHCYLELSQSENGRLVAKAKAVIWKSQYYDVVGKFVNATGERLKEGISILAQVRVAYSELYGMTLTVEDLEPEYSLGLKEMQRRKTIEMLEKEGLLEKQQSLSLPLLPYSLAVISARDAAGYGDFRRHLLENEYGFAFNVDLYEASMQGELAPESIVDALDRIEASKVRYDAVLILRGGGSALDLDCFDDYGMAYSIANFPLPVFTAIGHDKDYHVADMVAFRFVKTPTALADTFIECYMSEDERIAGFCSRMRLAFIGKITEMQAKVDRLEMRIKSADPRNILARGYALATDSRGIVLKNAEKVNVGDKVSILFADGTLKCTVNEKI